LLVLALHLRERISLPVEGKISEPLDDGTHCKLFSHFKNLSLWKTMDARSYYEIG
jgi:hypothetical protein